jgi:hypothetical protein
LQLGARGRLLPQDYRKRLKRNLEELKQCDRGRTDLDATDIEPLQDDSAGSGGQGAGGSPLRLT